MTTPRRLQVAFDLIESRIEVALTAATVAAMCDASAKTSGPSPDFEQVRNEVLSNLSPAIDRVKGRTGHLRFNLQLHWMVEGLSDALDKLRALDLEKIAVVRRANKDTRSLLESELANIRDRLKAPTSGVIECVAETFKRAGDVDIHVLDLVASVEKQVKLSLRLISVLRNRFLSFMLLDLRATHLIVCAIALIPVLYFVTKFHFEQPVSVQQQVASDVYAVSTIWHTEANSFLDKVTATAKFTSDAVFITPAIILVATIPLAIIRRYFIASPIFQMRIAGSEQKLRLMAEALKFSRGSLINVGGIDMSTKTITINESTINAPVTMADSIQSSFNTVQASPNEAELKQLIGDLLKEVARVGDKWGEHRDHVLANSEALSKEVSLKKPRREWYELSINGLKDAATAIGGIGDPIVKTVTKLLPLLIQLFP
jgi:hypothetical protein